jgi:hypothetical protein
LIPYDWLPQQTRLKFNNLIGIQNLLILMNMRANFIKLTATDPTRLKIETAKRPDIFETAKRPNIFKPNTEIDQKQAQHETLRSTNIIIEQTQVHLDKPRSIVEL